MEINLFMTIILYYWLIVLIKSSFQSKIFFLNKKFCSKKHFTLHLILYLLPNRKKKQKKYL